MSPAPLNSSPEALVLPVDHSSGEVASDYGDVRAEFEALVSDCGVYDLSGRVKIKLSGTDQVRWLNGMVTNNIRDLGVNQGVYAFLLNPQGRILADLYAYNRNGSLVIDTDRSQLDKLLAIFDKYIIMDDVEVENLGDRLTAIGVAGPNVRNVWQAAGIELPEQKPLQLAELTWRDIQLTIVRSDHPSVESYEIWLGPEGVPSLWHALLKSGARPAGTTALELLRVAAGLPRYGLDIRERDLPQETEQDRALHFAKGCYVGQEIVERIRSRGAVHRQFAGFDIQAQGGTVELPAPGAKIQVDGKDVGELTSVACLPVANGERPVALGYIRREAAMAGKKVSAEGKELTVVRLPFIETKR